MEGTLCSTGTFTRRDADDGIGIANGYGEVSLWRVWSILMPFYMVGHLTLIPGICVYDPVNNDTSDFVLNPFG